AEAAEAAKTHAPAEDLVGCRRPLEFVLVEDTVVVDVQVGEQVLHEIIPGGLDGLAVHADVQPDQHRPGLAEEDEVLHVVRFRFCSETNHRGTETQRSKAENETQNLLFVVSVSLCLCGSFLDTGTHASTSVIGLAVGSTMRMGRPTLDSFCFLMSMPRA